MQKKILYACFVEEFDSVRGKVMGWETRKSLIRSNRNSVDGSRGTNNSTVGLELSKEFKVKVCVH